MRKDYHTHPQLMRVPDRIDRYAARAQELNIGALCITDHMPLSISSAADRIPKGQVGEYIRRVNDARERFDGVVDIRCGIELDYHPDFAGEIEDALAAGEFHHRLASSHMHLFYDPTREISWSTFAGLALENLCRATETNYFTAVAHLDMFRWAFTKPERFPMREDGYNWQDFEDLYREIFRNMKDRGLLLEINPHFAEKTMDLGRCYPERPLLDLAKSYGISFCYGSDAHGTDSVGAMLAELEQDPDYGPALRSWEEN